MNPIGLPGEPFVGRDEILADLIGALGRRSVVLLTGERRVGKTATLAQLRRQLPGSMVGASFDLLGCGALALRQVLPDLALSIAAAADVAPPEPGSFDEDGVSFASTFLPRVYETLGAGRCLVLLLDQLDQLDAGHGGGPLVRYLGRLMEWEDRLRFVFAAARVDALPKEVQALVRDARLLHLGPLGEPEARRLLALARPEGAPLSAEAEGSALRLCGGHPYLLRLLCQRLREDGASASAADIEAAGAAALREADAGLEWLWGGLSQAERRALSAVAELTAAGPGANEDEVAERLGGGGAEEVAAALLRLKERELLQRAAGHYRVRAGLLRAWVAARKPLQLLTEAAAPPSVADTLYGSAVGLRRHGDLDAAADLLQHALRADPGHLPARLLRGEILVSLGRWAAAVEALEPAGAQAGAQVLLVRALLGRAAEQERGGDEAGALGSVEQALALAPADADAQERRRALLVRQGDAALLSGDLDRAAAAYGQAGVADKVSEIAARRRRRRQDELAAAAQEHAWQGAWAQAAQAYQALLADAEGDDRARIEAGLSRAREELALAEQYEAGAAAYARGDVEQARRHFAGVLHARPGYREVEPSLLRALGGAARRETLGGAWIGGAVCGALLLGGVLGWWAKPAGTAKGAAADAAAARAAPARALVRAEAALLARRWVEAEAEAARALAGAPGAEERAVAADVKERAARGRDAEGIVGQLQRATPEEVVRLYQRLPAGAAQRAQAAGLYARALSLYAADRLPVLEGARAAGRCAEFLDGTAELIRLDPEGTYGRDVLQRGCREARQAPAPRRVAKAREDAPKEATPKEATPKEARPREATPKEAALRNPF